MICCSSEFTCCCNAATTGLGGVVGFGVEPPDGLGLGVLAPAGTAPTSAAMLQTQRKDARKRRGIMHRSFPRTAVACRYHPIECGIFVTGCYDAVEGDLMMVTVAVSRFASAARRDPACEGSTRPEAQLAATSGSSRSSSGFATTFMVSSMKRTRSNVMQFTGQWSSQILQLVQRS